VVDASSPDAAATVARVASVSTDTTHVPPTAVPSAPPPATAPDAAIPAAGTAAATAVAPDAAIPAASTAAATAVAPDASTAHSRGGPPTGPVHSAATAATTKPDAPVRETREPPRIATNSATPSAAPTPAVKRTGELAVLVKPWAMIWLNGKSVGQTPYREKIPVGRYRLRIQNDEAGKDETVSVTINADQTTTIERKW
jgi:hypothetical protein